MMLADDPEKTMMPLLSPEDVLANELGACPSSRAFAISDM